MERQGEGIPGPDGLLHQIKRPQNKFRVDVRRTAPCFVPQYRGTPASPATLNIAEPEPVLSFFKSDSQPSSASATSARTTSANVTSTRATSAYSPQQPEVEKHTNPPFLKGEEDSDEIGLNDGKEVYIDDVLETAEWCVP